MNDDREIIPPVLLIRAPHIFSCNADMPMSLFCVGTVTIPHRWHRNHQTTENSSMADFKHKIGSLVRLHGLSNAAYNGRLGKVVDVADLGNTGRLLVELQEEVRIPLLQEIKIKPENMRTACNHCHKADDEMQFCGKCRVAG